MCEAESPRAKKLKSTAGPSAPTRVNANECITFHLLKFINGVVAMEDDGHFPPEMTHQLFGEDEQIKGFDGLEIDVFFTPRFQALIDVKFASKTLGATDLKEPFTLAFPAGFFQEKSDFDKALQEENPLDISTLGEVMLSAETEEGTKFSIVKSRLSEASQEIKDLHARLQPLLYFYVDAASAIDAEDPAWDLLFAVETSPEGTEIVGFTTAYNFYVFPDRKRVRLSQILVLPPHQGRGIGSLLMEAVYKLADSVNAVDITFEDPTEDLQRMRDKRDLQRMMQQGWLTKEVTEIQKSAGGDETKLAASPELLTRIQTELRMSKQQTKRMWETLLYATAATSGDVKAVETTERFVGAAIKGLVSAAKKDSKNKAVKDTDSGFIMMRVPMKKEGKGPVVPNVPVEECTAEQQEAMIEDAVASRIEELQRIVLPKEGGDA